MEEGAHPLLIGRAFSPCFPLPLVLRGCRSRVGVPASAGSQQGPSGPRSPFFLKKRGHGNGAEAPEPLPPEGGTPAGAASRNIDLNLALLASWRFINCAARRSCRVAADRDGLPYLPQPYRELVAGRLATGFGTGAGTRCGDKVWETRCGDKVCHRAAKGQRCAFTL